MGKLVPTSSFADASYHSPFVLHLVQTTPPAPVTKPRCDPLVTTWVVRPERQMAQHDVLFVLLRCQDSVVSWVAG